MSEYQSSPPTQRLIVGRPVGMFWLEPLFIGKVLDTVLVVFGNFGYELLSELGEIESVVEVVEDVDFDLAFVEVDEGGKEFLN